MSSSFFVLDKVISSTIKFERCVVPMISIKNFLLRHPKIVTDLHTESGPALSIAISPNGQFVACGGSDGVLIWDLKTFTPVDVQPFDPTDQSDVCVVCWVSRQKDDPEILCCGDLIGGLTFLVYQRNTNRFDCVQSYRIGNGVEILCISADRFSKSSNRLRLATSTLDRCFMTWTFNSSTQKISPIHSKAYQNGVVPKAMAFDSNKKHDIFVFGLYDGNLYKYNGKNCSPIGQHRLGNRIGNAAVDLGRRLCVVDNVGNGFNLFNLDSGNFIRNLPTRDPRKSYPKGVVFANKGNAVVGGSDHGTVYVFDTDTGKVLHRLSHAMEGGIQAIAVHDFEDNSVLIAAVSTTTPGKNPIRLWKWRPNMKDPNSSKVGAEVFSWVMMVFAILFKFSVAVAAICFVVDLHGGYDVAAYVRRLREGAEQ